VLVADGMNHTARRGWASPLCSAISASLSRVPTQSKSPSRSLMSTSLPDCPRPSSQGRGQPFPL
jgi:hypothetical protein